MQLEGLPRTVFITIPTVVIACFLKATLHLLEQLFTFKTTFADHFLTPISSKMSMSFFLQSKRN